MSLTRRHHCDAYVSGAGVSEQRVPALPIGWAWGHTEHDWATAAAQS